MLMYKVVEMRVEARIEKSREYSNPTKFPAPQYASVKDMEAVSLYLLVYKQPVNQKLNLLQ